jgi:hypothetical protein
MERAIREAADGHDVAVNRGMMNPSRGFIRTVPWILAPYLDLRHGTDSGGSGIKEQTVATCSHDAAILAKAGA